MFGYKRLLAEKDARIRDLKEQINRLEALVPAFNEIPHTRSIPALQVESDAIMSGHDEQIELTAEQQDELDKLEEAQSEATRLLTGNYEN